MLDSTAGNATRENVDIERNIYGRRAPRNYGLRYGGTGTYDYYARPDVAERYAPPEPMPPLRDDMAMTSMRPAPPVDDARIEELWQRLNSNAVPRSAVDGGYAPVRTQAFSGDGQVRMFDMPARAGSAAPARKKNRKLSTQGKVILAVYLAVILVILTLVIVNAGKINAPAARPDAGNGIEYVDLADGISLPDCAAGVSATGIPGMRD